jgi:hypothetical protein
LAGLDGEFRGIMEGIAIIPLKQVLAAMEAATEPFSLRFVKLNEQKGSGGELVAISSQLLSGKGTGQQLAPAPDPAPVLSGKPDDVEELEAWLRRNPNHYDNMTRNLVSTINGHYTKVHIYLITEFEGKKVII